MFIRRTRVCGGAGCTSVEKSQSALIESAQSVSFIPRSELFADPTYSALKLSPDGKQIAYKKWSNGALNIWGGPTDDPKAAVPVTSFKLSPKKFRCGRTPLETLLDGKSVWAEKNLAQI